MVRTRKRAGTAQNANPANPCLCCMKAQQLNKGKKRRCTLCKKRSSSSTSHTTEKSTPIITSMSDEFKHRMRPSSSLERKPRDYSICNDKRKKCLDKLKRLKCDNLMSSSRSSSSFSSDRCATNGSKGSICRRINQQKSTRKSLTTKSKRSKRSSGGSSAGMSCSQKLQELQSQLNKMKEKQMNKKRSKSKKCAGYSYRFGRKYPGMKIGHRECFVSRGLVPPNMGWLWNVPTLGINQVLLEKLSKTLNIFSNKMIEHLASYWMEARCCYKTNQRTYDAFSQHLPC